MSRIVAACPCRRSDSRPPPTLCLLREHRFSSGVLTRGRQTGATQKTGMGADSTSAEHFIPQDITRSLPGEACQRIEFCFCGKCAPSKWCDSVPLGQGHRSWTRHRHRKQLLQHKAGLWGPDARLLSEGPARHLPPGSRRPASLPGCSEPCAQPGMQMQW
jgi:hypothetical protein